MAKRGDDRSMSERNEDRKLAKERFAAKTAVDVAEAEYLSGKLSGGGAGGANTELMANPYFAKAFGDAQSSIVGGGDRKFANEYAMAQGLKAMGAHGIERSKVNIGREDTAYNASEDARKLQRGREEVAFADKYNYDNFTAPQIAQQQGMAAREKELFDRDYKMRSLEAKGGLDAGQRSTAYGDALKAAQTEINALRDPTTGLIPHPAGKPGKDGKPVFLSDKEAQEMISTRAGNLFTDRVSFATGGAGDPLAGRIGTETGGSGNDRVMDAAAGSSILGDTQRPQTGSPAAREQSQQQSIARQLTGQMQQPTVGQEYQGYGTYQKQAIGGGDPIYQFNRGGSPFFTNQGAVDRGPGFVPVQNAAMPTNTLAQMQGVRSGPGRVVPQQAAPVPMAQAPQPVAAAPVGGYQQPTSIAGNIQRFQVPQQGSPVPAQMPTQGLQERLFRNNPAMRQPVQQAGQAINQAVGQHKTWIDEQSEQNRNKKPYTIQDLMGTDIPFMKRKPTGLNQYDAYRYFNR